MERFKDNVAIVTDAGTGIGQAIAAGFVEEGACVAFVGRRMEKLEAASTGLPKERVLCLSCDVADRPSVNAVVQQVVDQFSPVNVLVNNVGINTNPWSVAEIAPADWDYTVAVNLTGAFNCIRAVLPGMREEKGGVIINVSSIAGLRASKPAGAVYSAAKHGMVALNHSINDSKRTGIAEDVL